MERKSFTVSIAIAEDHRVMRTTVKLLIESFGYNVVIEAGDGNVLIQRIAKSVIPDICVIDARMPILDGFKTTSYIKARWPFIKILILSIHDHTWFKSKARDSGADAFVSKLAPPDTLRKALENLAKS